MDAGTIAAAYSGLKYAKDSLGTLIQGKIEVEAQAKITDALSKLGSAQDAMFAMREELFELQGKNARLKSELEQEKAWNEKLEAYELCKTAGGAVVYRSLGIVEHYVCPACINEQKLQILQDNRTYSGKYRCVACEAEFPIDPSRAPPPIRVVRG